jgi:transposase
MEADGQKQAEYIENLQTIPLDKRVYIDESGVDRNLVKERGWGKVGEQLIGKKKGKREKRINIIAGYVNKEAIAPLIFEEKCETELFNKWLEELLLPVVRPGQVIIMDNATFHKSPKTRQLIAGAKCELVYLPAYSPELNPIEKYWAKMKKWLRENRDRFNDILEAIKSFLVVT